MLDYIKPLANGLIVVIHTNNGVVHFEVVRPNCDLAENDAVTSRAFFPRGFSEMDATISELEYAARRLSDYIEDRPGGYDWMDYSYDLLDNVEERLS